MASNPSITDTSSIRAGEGYKKLVIWKNCDELRRKVYLITSRFPPIEFRRVAQLRDATRSAKQNVQEGYKCGSLGGYVRYLNISLGSLGESKGDIDDLFQDGLINEIEFKDLDKLCGTTDFLIKKMIKSMRQADKNGTWKNFNG